MGVRADQDGSGGWAKRGRNGLGGAVRRVCGGERGAVDRRLSIFVLWGKIEGCNNEPQSFSLELV